MDQFEQESGDISISDTFDGVSSNLMKMKQNEIEGKCLVETSKMSKNTENTCKTLILQNSGTGKVRLLLKNQSSFEVDEVKCLSN